MTWRPDQPNIRVVYGDPSSLPDAATAGVTRTSGHVFGQMPEHMSGSEILSGQKSGGFPHAQHADILGRGDSVARYDPHHVNRAFPARWRAYIRGNFRDLGHVSQVFGVSGRTARNWWNGETGANGGHVAIAMIEHPVQATRMLFAAE